MSVKVDRKEISDSQASLIRTLLTLQPKATGPFDHQVSKPPVPFFLVDVNEKKDMILSLPHAFAATLLGKYLNNDQRYNQSVFKFTGTLLEKQKSIIEEAREQIRLYNSTTLRLPPGWGKTVLGALLACESQLLTCVLFHREIIGQGWRNTFRDFTTAKVYTVETSEKNKDFLTSGAGFFSPSGPNVILCLDKRVGSLPQEIIERVGFLIIDEAHCFCTPDHVRGLLSFHPKYVVAETATLHRDDGMHSMITSICGNHFVYRSNDKPFNVFKLDTGVEPEYKLNPDGKVNWASLSNNLACHKVRNSLILTLVFNNSQEKILILTRTKEHASILYEALKLRNYSVDYMMGNKNSYQDSKVLIGTMSKIGTGFDEKSFCSSFNGVRISLVILAASIKSSSLLEQNVGRAFRADFPSIIHLVDRNKTIINHWNACRAWYNKNLGTIYDVPCPSLIMDFFPPTSSVAPVKPKLVILST